MKQILFIIAALAAAALTFSGCNKAPMNGHLDGQWQLMTVETPSRTVSLTSGRYYCFYRHVANLRPGGPSANLYYDETDKILTLEFPYPNSDLRTYEIPHSTPYTCEFKVIKLSRKQLVMTLDDSLTYTFRKF